MNLNNLVLRSADNTDNGEVSEDTLFHYRQNGDIISATYQGGNILQGQLIGKMFADHHLEFVYQHINTVGEIMTGQCKSYPEINQDGKLMLREFWQWTCKDQSKGQSLLIEL